MGVASSTSYWELQVTENYSWVLLERVTFSTSKMRKARGICQARIIGCVFASAFQKCGRAGNLSSHLFLMNTGILARTCLIFYRHVVQFFQLSSNGALCNWICCLLLRGAGCHCQIDGVLAGFGRFWNFGIWNVASMPGRIIALITTCLLGYLTLFKIARD